MGRVPYYLREFFFEMFPSPFSDERIAIASEKEAGRRLEKWTGSASVGAGQVQRREPYSLADGMNAIASEKRSRAETGKVAGLSFG